MNRRANSAGTVTRPCRGFQGVILGQIGKLRKLRWLARLGRSHAVANAFSDHVDMPRGPRPPYLVVADALRERLDGGEWLPGEALPSAAALAQEYETSSSTVGRAVRVLIDEGRLTSVKGWGVFVAS